MKIRQRTWAIVLAAGDGTRLATLTRDDQGNAVPKQFCSLSGGRSLLDEALQRAKHVAPRERTCAIVAASHEHYWRRALWSLPSSNVIVQPRNCGTAIGILYATLSILARDPLARIVFLPADHYVRDETTLAATLRRTATSLTREPSNLVLIGIEPDEVDPELGYIVPGARVDGGLQTVGRFVEKPDAGAARDLIARGAVWNSFIFAAQGAALIGEVRRHLPAIVADMETALARDARLGGTRHAIEELYESLPSVDFSRVVLQGAEGSLRLVTAPACGWSDLGTPRRVADALLRLRDEPTRAVPSRIVSMPAFVNLAAQFERISIAS